MKKLTSLLLVLLMLIGMLVIPASAADEVSVYLFGEKLEFDVPAQIVNGRTLVPVRKIFEELGYKVDWDNDTRTAIAVSEERTIRITENSYTMYVNDEAKTLDVPAQIIGGRTMVPARAISEASGYKVDWGEATRSVFIIKPVETVGPYDELKDLFKEKGTYIAGLDVYAVVHPVEDKTVNLMYEPEDERISVFYAEHDDHTLNIGVTLRKDEEHGVSFAFDFGRKNSKELLGRYPTPGEPYEIFSTNLSGEDLEFVKGFIAETMDKYLDVALYDFSGYKLADFGIAY